MNPRCHRGFFFDPLATDLILGIFAALAEYDRESIWECSRSSIELAKAQGKHMGRPTGMNHAALATVRSCVAAGMSIDETAAATGIGRSSVVRYCAMLKGE